MLRADFDSAALWVLSKLEAQGVEGSTSLAQLAQALAALENLAQFCKIPLLVTGMMPGSTLEVLVLPVCGSGVAGQVGHQHALPGNRLPAGALKSIGRAVQRELESCHSDIVQTVLEGGCEVLVFRPDVRLHVLTATGLTLIETETEAA